MDYKKKVKTTVDKFYVECIEEFKEAELKIANDSRFRTIFRKKDYKGNIALLKNCQKQARSLRFPTGDIPGDDELTRNLVQQTQSSIQKFSRLCDSYVLLQSALQQKADGGPMPYKEYMQIYKKTQEDRVEMNRALQDLDLVYTEFIEDEDYDVYEFL